MKSNVEAYLQAMINDTGTDGLPTPKSRIGKLLYVLCGKLGLIQQKVADVETVANTQPDWNRNDPNAPDYVKGRTHYEKTSFRNVGNTVGTVLQENADLGFLYTGRCPFGVEPIENVQYKVTFGETVLGPALCRANKNCDYGTCIGNAYLYGLFVHRNSTKTKEELESEGYTDTKEDFVYVPHQYFITTNPNVKAGQAPYVLLYEGTTTIKTLDEKYIPDTIPRVGSDVIIPSSTSDSTKKFKITVDDSGAVTATEVTEE